MQWRIIVVGKPSQTWVKQALDGYLKRLQHYARVELVAIKEGPIRQVESLIESACEEGLRVLLDERGKQLRSVELADWVDKQEISSCKRICLVIGGANGHSEQLRASSRVTWSLSTLTLQHDIALIVLVEQLYRAYSILRGEPYHRE